ncbi:hypothetical protein [Bacillus sp. T33-2]|uniref:hypothetical protein n=1 Tax=Bacillus sp. T33-2 TaxID=2054168 RepID=UPI000C779E7F|nr:hypothetical protein [Bacillus sp. T33-2]PLR99599.1 hypothetical protein CVD19_00620 [Bacillus sp. T33-2]
MPKRKIDITDQKYGRLTVLQEVAPNKYARRYLCKCECGNEAVVYMNALRKGNTQSCGCLQKERVSNGNFIDLTGKKFGKLTTKSRQGSNRGRKVNWLCLCDCGKEILVASDRLLNGITKSCGCLREEKGKAVQEYNEKNLRVDEVFTPLLKSKIRSDNSTGVKGVTTVKRKNSIKYQARIYIKNEAIYLGTFDTIEEATKARKKGEEIYHKPYLD